MGTAFLWGLVAASSLVIGGLLASSAFALYGIASGMDKARQLLRMALRADDFEIIELGDRIGEDPHKLSGRAKDMGSAAVFISLWTVAMTWGLIGYERFMKLGV